MKMEAADTHRHRQAVQVRRLVGAVDQAAGLCHDGGLALGQRRLLRLAAQAGPEAGRFGRIAAVVERHVLAQRRPRPHDGRQYTPVLRTEYQNTPSAPASRRCTAAQRNSSLP
jgi:hypothetical protein